MWLLLGCLCAWAGLHPSVSRAQDGDSAVVIVRVPGDETILSRLRAELSSYRFRAIELPDSPARRAEALSQLAQQRDAQAALRAKPDAMAIELWVRAASGNAPASEELVSAGPGRDPEVLALRVTEAMRARGLTLPPLSAAPRKPTPAADGGGRSAPPVAPPPSPEVDVAEPHTLQPGEVTEPVVKPPEPVKAAPASPKPGPPAATPAKPAEPQSARPEAKPAAQSQAPARPEPKAAEEKPAVAQKPEEKKARKPEDKPRAAVTQPEQPVDTAPAALAPPPSQVATESTFADERDALLYVEVGPAGVLSPGPNRLGPAMDLLLSFTFRPYQTSSISLVGLIPLLSTKLVGDGASVDVRTYGIGGFGDLHWPLGRLELSGGLGVLGLISTVLVTPVQPLFVPNPNPPARRLAALLGRVGASLSLTRDLRLSASIMAGLTVEPVQVQFHPTEGTDPSPTTPDTTWGWPLLFASLSIELALPWDR